jgi:hypothetical protein
MVSGLPGAAGGGLAGRNFGPNLKTPLDLFRACGIMAARNDAEELRSGSVCQEVGVGLDSNHLSIYARPYQGDKSQKASQSLFAVEIGEEGSRRDPLE